MSLMLAIVIAVGFLPATAGVFTSLRASAATYTVNGVTIPLPGFEVGKNVYSQYNCWDFAQMVYKKLWNNQSFTASQSTSDNQIKDVAYTDAARKATAANLKNYISKATPGSVLRISRTMDYVKGSSDGDAGHSMIIVARSNNDFTVYDSTTSGIGLRTLTYDNYANYWTLSGNLYIKDAYIKYIKAPGAGGGSVTYFSSITAYDVTETDASIKGDFPGFTYVTGDGFYIGTDRNNLQKVSKNLKGKADGAGNYLNIYFKMSEWYGTLQKGTTYYYKLYYLDGSGVERQSEIGSFKTGGTTSAPTSATLLLGTNRVLAGTAVSLSVSSPGATTYQFFVQKNGETVYQSSAQNSSQFSYVIGNPGLYSAYVIASNTAGNVLSNNVYFEVISDEPTLVATYDYNGHTYSLYLSTSTWTEAKTWCENKGGYLMTITSAGEQAALESLLGDYTTGCYSLGAENVTTGSYRWITGETWAYECWDTGEPSNSENVEHYLGTYHGTKWHDFRNDSQSLCGFVMESVSTAHTHTWNSGETVTPATCTEAGSILYTCTICGEVKTEEIPAKGHDYGNWVTVNDLQHERICKNDHSHVEKQNHVWNAGVVSGNEIVYTCTVCGGQKTEPTGEDVVKVLVDNVNARPGESVDVFLQFENMTSIKSMSISDIVFDEDKLELTGGEWLPADSLLKDWKLAERSGVITFGSSVDIAGQIFKLTFKVKDNVEDSETEITCKITAKTKPEGGTETSLSVSVVPGVIKISSVMRGDVNGDNSVDSDDAIYLLYYTLLPDTYPVNQNGDMNADGSVDSDDAIYLLYYTLLPDSYPLH